MVHPSGPDVLDARRAPRVPLRFPVELRHHRTTWVAESEDLGARGCQVVSPRPLAEGRDVALAIECTRLGRVVAARGRVAWSRPDAPARLGISFEVAPADRDWFSALLSADPPASAAASRAPLRLPREAPLHLGEPPRAVVDFSADELAVLRAIGDGSTVGEVAEALAGVFHRARGALFSLVARRLVHLRPGPPGTPPGWQAILARREGRGQLLEPPRLPPEGERLYHEGIQHLGAGRVDLALARFREALVLAPEDARLRGTLARLERWK